MIHAWGITDKGAVRTQNQDGFYLDVPSEHLAVGVVCDGMGGAKAGNIASLIAVETFVDALQGMQPDGDGEAGPAAVLSRAAETANTAVYHRAVTDPDCRGMGTTMVAALVVEQTAYLLNIGDSRAYPHHRRRDHPPDPGPLGGGGHGGAGGHHPRGGPYSSPEEPDHPGTGL